MSNWHRTFDWKAAIALNRDALRHVLIALYAMVKPDTGSATLPRPLRSAILRILRPAESAARRLIVIAARSMSASTYKPCTISLPDFACFAAGSHTRTPAFRLFDPRKRFDFNPDPSPAINKNHPRISVPLYSEPNFPPTKDKHAKTPNTESIFFRMAALKVALDNVNKQARKLVRANAKRAERPAGPRRVGPLRPGLPPGYRLTPFHAVDKILRECHTLAHYALEPPI